MIKLEEVTKSYVAGENRIRALKGVSLEISEGSFCVIVGSSGSGKSTLMNILGCLDKPDRGRYYLYGEDMTSASAGRLAAIRGQRIGFVFQAFNLIPGFTALENVELPLIYSGVRRALRREMAARALERVGLKDRLTHLPSQMSGGQQQRTAIARAIVSSPDLILADEPTGNLDSASAMGIMELFTELHLSGSTVALITHDRAAASYGTRLITIENGNITQDI